MLYALLLADKIQPGDEEAQTILAHAAIFHDTRRIDENRDTGHGARATEFYETFCREHPELPYRPESACIMRWHDRYKGRPIDEVANEILAPWLFPYTEQPPTELRTLTYTMAEGYAACLYTYKWCEVMAADAMSRFRKEGIFTPPPGQITAAASWSAAAAYPLCSRYATSSAATRSPMPC